MKASSVARIVMWQIWIGEKFGDQRFYFGLSFTFRGLPASGRSPRRGMAPENPALLEHRAGAVGVVAHVRRHAVRMRFALFLLRTRLLLI